MGCPGLMPPPTCGLAMPLTPPRPRAASPAKSLVDSQSWSITVNSTQAPRRRHASAGTELWTGQSGACCSHMAQAGGTAGQVGTHKWKSSSYTGCNVRALTWVLWLRTSGKRCGGPSSTITKGSLRPRRYIVSQMSAYSLSCVCPVTPPMRCASPLASRGSKSAACSTSTASRCSAAS